MSVSSEASMYPRPRPGSLRPIAEKIEAATDRRVQSAGGKLVMPLGGPVPLPEPIVMEIVTDDFPMYAASSRGPLPEEGPFTERSQ